VRRGKECRKEKFSIHERKLDLVESTKENVGCRKRGGENIGQKGAERGARPKEEGGERKLNCGKEAAKIPR